MNGSVSALAVLLLSIATVRLGSGISPLSTLQQRLPKAIIIGVKKAGTRALLEYLKLHPRIRATGPEVHFFDRHYNRGVEWYRRQMPYSDQNDCTVEKTPSYFITRDAPSAMHQLDPGLKLIIVVRDPVTRAISDYTQTSSKRLISNFSDLAFANLTAGTVNVHWKPIKIGLYARHLQRWLQHFPIKQMHFVDGERLITHPAQETSLVENFLGLEPFVSEKHFVLNTAKGFPCLVKPESPNKTHCLGKTKGRTHPKIPKEQEDALRRFYKLPNDNFYRLVGKNFHW